MCSFAARVSIFSSILFFSNDGIGQSVTFEVIPMIIRSAASLGGQDAGIIVFVWQRKQRNLRDWNSSDPTFLTRIW